MSHQIRSISIIGGFLNGVRIDLAEGLNCFIGARGTGKTTIIELIRFVLDALPSRDNDTNERRRIETLVEHNLGGGRVQLEFQTKSKLTYLISRSWGEDPVVLTSDGDPTNLTLKSGGIFSADIYGSNAVERMADHSTSQLELIDRFEADAISDIDSQLKEIEQKLVTNTSHILSLETKHAELSDAVGTLPEVEEKLKAFSGIGENTQAIDRAHAQKALRDRERSALESIDGELVRYQETLRSQSGQIVEKVASYLSEEMRIGPNGEIVSDLARELAFCDEEVNSLLHQIEKRIERTRDEFKQKKVALGNVHGKQELTFRDLIEQHKIAMEQATERANLERIRNTLLEKKRESNALAEELQTLSQHRSSLLDNLSEQRDQRFSIRQKVAARINEKISPMIRIRVEQFGDVGLYQTLLGEALKGVGIQHHVVAQRIATSVPPRELSDMVKGKDTQGLIEQSGINPDQARKAVDTLCGHRILLDLGVVDLKDKPKIELKDGDTYKDSLTLSTGQKCTSILPILLLDSDRPLLVDQPEDNLDNGFIYETVVTRLREVKNRRQLIFVTHNPNIPVLGDAGKVFVFKSSGSEAWIEKEGSVDDCREHIVRLLEGGEEAFKLRQKKYEY